MPYITDPGNFDDKFPRSYIRKNIIPQALKINPGLRKVIKKKIEKSFNEECAK